MFRLDLSTRDYCRNDGRLSEIIVSLRKSPRGENRAAVVYAESCIFLCTSDSNLFIAILRICRKSYGCDINVIGLVISVVRFLRSSTSGVEN